MMQVWGLASFSLALWQNAYPCFHRKSTSACAGARTSGVRGSYRTGSSVAGACGQLDTYHTFKLTSLLEGEEETNSRVRPE